MSLCARCGAAFSCAMVAGERAGAAMAGNVDDTATTTTAAADPGPRCWCTYLPAAVALPSEPGGACWCASCLAAHIAAAEQRRGAAD
ncbi:hypothetical protein [Rugamonas sp.]|uniref:hypothetical protein n=1 Tax=Rugamonas sp. TaxID=1926287 RepID=UPI0025D0CD63|nr:hypothetical protein [Rugamonas sp.]